MSIAAKQNIRPTNFFVWLHSEQSGRRELTMVTVGSISTAIAAGYHICQISDLVGWWFRWAVHKYGITNSYALR